MSFESRLILQQAGSKPAGRSKAQAAKQTRNEHQAMDAKESANSLIEIATAKIQIGMLCKKTHSGRLCYAKYNNECGSYTPEHVLEHARLLVCDVAFASIQQLTSCFEAGSGRAWSRPGQGTGPNAFKTTRLRKAREEVEGPARGRSASRGRRDTSPPRYRPKPPSRSRSAPAACSNWSTRLPVDHEVVGM